MPKSFASRDGHTYYRKDGELYAHPTNMDGSCDFDPDVEIRVADFEEPLSQAEIDRIKSELDEPEA